MTLREYLDNRCGLSARELADAIGVQRAQISQWRNGRNGRQPGAAYAVAIERATGGAVSRQELRADFADIWPELAEAA